MRRLRPGVVLGALAAAALSAVVWSALVMAGYGGDGGPAAFRQPPQVVQALFDWRSFDARQDALVRSANGLTRQLGGDGAEGSAGLEPAVQAKGVEIKQALSRLMRGLKHRHRRRAAGAVDWGKVAAEAHHKYVPMEEELAMLKVQKQMRSEHRQRGHGSDRIEGAGDVAAVVNEQEQRDERSALMEDPDMGPDTKTRTAFENCEDGSLTAEDAELCGRRASAIKMLTRSAIQKQMDESPAVRPADAETERDTARENQARKKLVEYALIGKQYMAWVHSKDKVKRKETDGTLAKRAALLSQGHDAACYKQCGNEHPCLQLCAKMQQAHAAGRTSPQQQTRSTRLTSARTAPSSRHTQDLPSSGPAIHRSGHSKSTGSNTGTSAQAKAAGAKLGRAHAKVMRQTGAARNDGSAGRGAAERAGSRNGGAFGQEARVGDLGALQAIAKAVPAHLTTPDKDSRTRIADMESAIDATQARLAREKMAFTKEMLKRQQQLQAEFAQSMQQIHTGLAIVDNVSAEGERGLAHEGAVPDPLAAPAGSDKLAAQQAAWMQQQRDGAIAAAAAATNSQPALSSKTNPVVSEVEREIAASHLFKHPPTPASASGSRRKSAEQAERDTVKAALQQQWAAVASDSSVAPQVHHDTWTDVISQLSQAAAAAGKAHGDRHGRAAAASARAPGEGSAAGELEVGAGKRKSSMAQQLRLLSEDMQAGYEQGGKKSHVGPAPYKTLVATATADMRAAWAGAPTMDAAAQNAFKADDLAASLSKVAKNKAKLKDAERLLCTVAMLKDGLCSTSAPHKAVSAPVRRSALRLRVPRKPVLQPVLKPGHLASDVEKNVAEMFSANHGGAAR